MARNEPLSVNVPTDLKLAAEKYAESDGRSVASLVRKVLHDFLKQKGVLAKRPREVIK
jgi:hypothetical protein